MSDLEKIFDPESGMMKRPHERIGHDREAWSALAASSLRDGRDTDQGLH